MNYTWVNEGKLRRLIREAFYRRLLPPERSEVESDVFFDFATGRITGDTLVEAWGAIENHFNPRKVVLR